MTMHHTTAHALPPPTALSALPAFARRLLGCFGRVKTLHLGDYEPPCMICCLMLEPQKSRFEERT